MNLFGDLLANTRVVTDSTSGKWIFADANQYNIDSDGEM